MFVLSGPNKLHQCGLHRQSNFSIHQLSVKFLDNLLDFSTLHAARHSMLQNFDPPSESPDLYGAFAARRCSMLRCSRIRSIFLEFRHIFDVLSTFSQSFFEFFLDPAARLDFFSIFLDFSRIFRSRIDFSTRISTFSRSTVRKPRLIRGRDTAAVDCEKLARKYEKPTTGFPVMGSYLF